MGRPDLSSRPPRTALSDDVHRGGVETAEEELTENPPGHYKRIKDVVAPVVDYLSAERSNCVMNTPPPPSAMASSTSLVAAGERESTPPGAYAPQQFIIRFN